MARTIGKRWPATAPKGDYQARCDYCDVAWRRSQLKRDRAGLLYCPDEGEGRDSVTLDEANAAAAESYRNAPRGTNDGGRFVKTTSLPEVHLLTLEDIEL